MDKHNRTHGGRDGQEKTLGRGHLRSRDDRAKADFLSRMSHELLTPMNAIVGMTRIASASDDMSKIKGCLFKIDEASKQLLGIIRDVTDLTRLDEGRLELVNGNFVLEHMLMRVCGEVMAQANEKAQDFQVIIDRNVPQVVRADESRLSQILSNLLMNAVKFTAARGKIRLRVSLNGLERDAADIAFEVSDTGIGISGAELGRIFEAFEQSDGSSSRVHGGLGLGLTISAQLVRLFGGKINVESELNTGSTFTFNIPAGIVDGAPAHTELKSASAGGLNILFVDDSAETRDYFAALMREYGVPCTCAESGFEALSSIEDAESAGMPYTVIFMDWRMPHMNGIETAAQISRRGGGSGTGPAIVLMAGIEWGVIEQAAAEAGIKHFLQKPLFPSSIIDTINQIVGLPAADTSRAAPDFGSKRILLVDDVAINREILAAYLERTGAELTHAGGGREAVEAVGEDPGAYDLVLMDLHMPDMDGCEATVAIRALGDPRARTLPIIALTAEIFEKDVARCRQAGMNGHLTKPVSEEKLVEKLAEYLLSRGRSATGDWRAYMPDFDVAQALGRLRGNKQLYAKMLSKLGDNTQFGALRDALAAGDTDAIHTLAGGLLPVAKNLCLCDILDLLVKIGTMARNKRVPEELADRFEATRARMFGKLGALIEALENGYTAYTHER